MNVKDLEVKIADFLSTQGIVHRDVGFDGQDIYAGKGLRVLVLVEEDD